MARDRLAALRAQQATQAQGGNPQQSQGYGLPSNPRAGGEGNPPQYSQSYAQAQDYGHEQYPPTQNYGGGDYARYDIPPTQFEQAHDSYEVKPSQQQSRGPTIKAGDVPFEDMSEFFNEISNIQDELRASSDDVSQLQSLHNKILTLASTEHPSHQAISSQITQTSDTLRRGYASLKTRIHTLEQGNANLRVLIPAGQSIRHLSMADVDTRAGQVSLIKNKFKEGVSRFAETEKQARDKGREQLERQVRIVNPNLDESEIKQMVRSAEEGGGNLFSQALMQSNGMRVNSARGALSEAQARAAELARIEKTIIELAQMFNDMAIMVEAQDIQIVTIETNAIAAEAEVKQGFDEVVKAKNSAAGARKKRWICFFILIIVLVIIVIIVVVKVVIPAINKNNDAPATTVVVTQAPATNAVTAEAIVQSQVVRLARRQLARITY